MTKDPVSFADFFIQEKIQEILDEPTLENFQQVLHQASHIHEAKIPDDELAKVQKFGDLLQTHLWPFIDQLNQNGELSDIQSASQKIKTKWEEILELFPF